MPRKRSVPRKRRTIPFEDTGIETWFERDRAQVTLFEAGSDKIIMEWRDEAVEEAVEDGFLDPKDWHDSAYGYAKHLGLV